MAPELRYDPNQPRAPAGSSDDGRWVAAGGESGGGFGGGVGAARAGRGNFGVSWLNRRPPGAAQTNTPADATATRVAMNIDPNVANDAGGLIGLARHRTIRLQDEEGFGHTIERHVGKTDKELFDALEKKRIRYIVPFIGEFIEYDPAQGSFDSVESANDFLNRIIEANAEIVDEVISGKRGNAILKKHFGYRTGKEAYLQSGRSAPIIRWTYEALVFIYHDPKSGFRVRTAYPFNNRPETR
jgi:hypothetical protein